MTTDGNFFSRCDDLQKSVTDIYESLAEKKLSYVKGDTSTPLKTITIGQLVEQSAHQYPNRMAISFYGGQKLTYAELLEKVLRRLNFRLIWIRISHCGTIILSGGYIGGGIS